MNVHHVMVTYWRDTSQPNADSRTITVAADSPRRVLDMLEDVVVRFTRDDAPVDVEDPGLWGDAE